MTLPAVIQPSGNSNYAVAATTLIVSFAIVAIGSFGPNTDLACIAALALVGGVALLWRAGEPPLLLFVFLFQWLQASVAIIQANLANLPLDDFFESRAPVAEATVLSLFALLALAIGMRLGAGPVRRDLLAYARAQSLDRPIRDWFVLYVMSWAAGTAAAFGASYSEGLSQFLLAINSLRWAFFFMLAVVHFNRGRKAKWWFPAAFLVELALSVGGYFSSFSTVFIITFLAMMMAGVKLTVGRILGGLVVGLVAIAFAIVWTAIKPEYRQFASQGETAQVVSVGYPERIQKIGELVSALDNEKLNDATQSFLQRLGYVEFFGYTLSNVPTNIPHEGGAILLDAVTRPFAPRAFFPDKPVIDDSERTRYYTGRLVAGAEQGTSISIGWPAEMYIDFGRWGMMLAAAGIGLFYGFMQRTFTTWSRSAGLLGYGVAGATLVNVIFLESSITKVLGGAIISLFVGLIFIRLAVPIFFPWIAPRRT